MAKIQKGIDTDTGREATKRVARAGRNPRLIEWTAGPSTRGAKIRRELWG